MAKEKEDKQDEKQEDTLETDALSDFSEIVFCFDTTGSMAPCISDVRAKLKDLIGKMADDIPGLRMGIIAHGDYCDGEQCIQTLDLTKKHLDVLDFIDKVPDTFGGDVDECYELALHTARNMSWKTKKGGFVIIGDAHPHDTDYVDNKDKLDWYEELDALCEDGVKVIALQCLRRDSAERDNSFWEKIAERAGTPLLQLINFGEAAETLAAVTYSFSADPAAKASYMKNLSARGEISSSMLGRMDALGFDVSELSTTEADTETEKD